MLAPLPLHLLGFWAWCLLATACSAWSRPWSLWWEAELLLLVVVVVSTRLSS